MRKITAAPAPSIFGQFTGNFNYDTSDFTDQATAEKFAQWLGTQLPAAADVKVEEGDQPGQFMVYLGVSGEIFAPKGNTDEEWQRQVDTLKASMDRMLHAPKQPVSYNEKGLRKLPQHMKNNLRTMD